VGSNTSRERLQRSGPIPFGEQEYQGNEPAQKRAPGTEEDDNPEGEGNRKSA
jgi:hypothetical protein